MYATNLRKRLNLNSLILFFFFQLSLHFLQPVTNHVFGTTEGFKKIKKIANILKVP